MKAMAALKITELLKARFPLKARLNPRGLAARAAGAARKVRSFFLNLNDDGIFALWAAAIILAGGLLWGLSARARSQALAGLANRALAEIGDARFIAEPLPAWRVSGPAFAAATWYVMNNRELAAVFPLFYEGVFTPCFAVFKGGGAVDTFLPLSRTARIAAERGTGGGAGAQIRHVEKAAARIGKKMTGGR